MRTMQLSHLDSPIAAFSRVNGTLFQIGGQLDRETPTTFQSSERFTTSNRLIQVDDFVLWCHKGRIYKFFGDAVFFPAGTFVGNFNGPTTAEPTGEIVQGNTSLATAYAIETNIGGDTFIKLLPIAGTFQNGETVTGQTSGATCVLGGVAQTRGDASFEGEWGVAHTLSATPSFENRVSGFFEALIDGSTAFFLLWDSPGGTINSLEFFPDESVDDQFVENLTLFTGQTYGYTEDAWGKGHFEAGVLYLPIAPFSSANIGLITYNASSKSVGVSLGTGSANARLSSASLNVVFFGGKILVGMVYEGQDTSLRELAGGNIDTEVLEFDGAFTSDRYDFSNNNTITRASAGTFLRYKDDLFIIMWARTSTGGKRGYIVAHVIEKGGAIICSNMYGDGINTENEADSAGFATKILPAFLDLGQTANPNVESTLFVYLEQETNNPDGEDILEIVHRGQVGVQVDADALEWVPTSPLTDVTYTWDGTTTVVTSGPSTKSAGDAIGLVSDKQLFEIVTVNPGNVVIKNPTGKTIPTGTGPMREVNAMTVVGAITACSRHCFTESKLGGGHRTFIKDEPNIRISSRAAVAGGLRLGLKAFGGGVGFASLYYGPDGFLEADTLATLKDPTVGAIVANENDTWPLDGSENFFTWDADADGVQSGENRRYLPRIRK